MSFRLPDDNMIDNKISFITLYCNMTFAIDSIQLAWLDSRYPISYITYFHLLEKNRQYIYRKATPSVESFSGMKLYGNLSYENMDEHRWRNNAVFPNNAHLCFIRNLQELDYIIAVCVFLKLTKIYQTILDLEESINQLHPIPQGQPGTVSKNLSMLALDVA